MAATQFRMRQYAAHEGDSYAAHTKDDRTDDGLGGISYRADRSAQPGGQCRLERAEVDDQMSAVTPAAALRKFRLEELASAIRSSCPPANVGRIVQNLLVCHCRFVLSQNSLPNIWICNSIV